MLARYEMSRSYPKEGPCLSSSAMEYELLLSAIRGSLRGLLVGFLRENRGPLNHSSTNLNSLEKNGMKFKILSC